MIRMENIAEHRHFGLYHELELSMPCFLDNLSRWIDNKLLFYIIF